MRTLRTIPTPWTPYTLMFTRDGTRLAIGGGGWYGGGGVALVDSRSGESRLFASASLPAFSEAGIGPTISGLCFSSDDRHLVASTWTSSQRAGPVILFEVVGLELRYRSTVSTSPAGRQWSSTPTGVLLDGARLALRNHRAPLGRMVAFGQLPPDIGRGPQPRHLTSSRLALVGGEVITGSHGLEGGSPGLVVVPRVGGTAQKHAIDDCPRVTAIGTTRRGELVTGGGDGELHVWSREADAWKPRPIRPATLFPAANFPELQRLTWATYGSNSIVGLCGLADGDRAVGVSAGGHLCIFDTEGTNEAWQLPGPGSPRSLAAHPDGGVVAVAIKQGGFGSTGLVSIVETSPREIDPAWRTPEVLSMARAADAHRQSSGLFDPSTLLVLADALEDAGASTPSAHLRGHDPRLRTCAFIEALLVN